MASRTLTLALAADIDDLKKGLSKADNEIQTFGDRVNEFGRKAALAFAAAAAAAAAYGTKLAIDGVKAAIEDEQAQFRLAAALKTATGATDAQIKATEDYILKTSLATGVSDDQLRPALQRLAVSTKDVSKAQELLGLALDVSKGSGKSLEEVANALGKAQDGNTVSLGRLGLGLSKAELSTLTFTEVQQKLADLYGGAAAKNAETFQGKIDKLKVGFDEAKESLGYALIPQVEKLITYLNDTGIPTLNAFIAGLTGDQGLTASLDESQKGAATFGRTIAGVAGIISGFITFIREAVGLLVEFANQAIKLINIVKPGADIGYIPNPSLTGTMLGQSAPTLRTNANARENRTTVNNITVQGAIDPVSTARQINNLIQGEATAAGTFAGLGRNRFGAGD